MKKFLETTIKVKHVLIVFVLFTGLVIGAIINKPKHHFRTHRPIAKFEHRMQRGQQMRNRMEQFKIQYQKLDDVEKHTIDSLRSLIKDGDRADRRVIFREMRDIMKGD
jgi:biopolymer transport protein ExbB/TolQ